MDIYLDELTGKYYIWDGSKFTEYQSGNNGASGQNDPIGVEGPQIGDMPDDGLADEAEHEAELEKERAEGDSQETEEEREQRIERAKKALEDEEIKSGIQSDNIRMSQRERQKQREKARKAALSAGGTAFNGGIQAFSKDLEDFLKNEIKEVEMATWSRQNRRYTDSPFIMQGSRFEDNTNIPSVGVYFDQSGSWTPEDVAKGKNAIACLYELQKKGKIKFELKYFSNDIYNDPAAARSDGGTGAGEKLINDIKNMKYDNVIVMTDSDFDSWSEILNAPNIKVNGAVWFLWKNGEDSKRLQAHLKGKKRNRNYKI